MTDLARQFNVMAGPARGVGRPDPPRPRPEPRLPGRRDPRAADADRGAAHEHGAARRDRPARTPRRAPSSSNRAAVQLERLDWLAQNLLELSKLESGLLALDLRPDDLRSTVESAVEQAEPSAHRRGVALVLELPPDPVRIRARPTADRPGRRRTWSATRSSSRRAAAASGSRSGRTATAPSSRCATRASGSTPSELPHIFERFYRGSSASEARGSGSGLGLAIVKSIVDMHGGRIAVESRVGPGSTFRVVLVRDPRVGQGPGHRMGRSSRRPRPPRRDRGRGEIFIDRSSRLNSPCQHGQPPIGQVRPTHPGVIPHP